MPVIRSRMVVRFIIHFILRSPPDDWNWQEVRPFALITCRQNENQEETMIYICSNSQPIPQPLGIGGLLCFSFSVTYLPKEWLSFKRRDKNNIRPVEVLHQQMSQIFNIWLDYTPEPHKLPAQAIPGTRQRERLWHSLCWFPCLHYDRLKNLGNSVQAN